MLSNTYGALYRAHHELQDDLRQMGGADVWLLTETWQRTSAQLPILPGMQRSYAAPRPGGRDGSGGVAVYLSDTLACQAHVWRMRPRDGVLWLRMRGVWGLPCDLLVAVCYLPPRSSPRRP